MNRRSRHAREHQALPKATNDPGWLMVIVTVVLGAAGVAMALFIWRFL